MTQVPHAGHNIEQLEKATGQHAAWHHPVSRCHLSSRTMLDIKATVDADSTAARQVSAYLDIKATVHADRSAAGRVSAYLHMY